MRGGRGNDGEEVRDKVGVAGALDWTGGSSRYENDSVETRDGLYTDGGRGISSGLILSSPSSLLTFDGESTVGTTEGVLMLAASSSAASVGSVASRDTAISCCSS
jgi:hypothetical protein